MKKLLKLIITAPLFLGVLAPTMSGAQQRGALQKETAGGRSIDIDKVRLMQKDMARCAFKRNRERTIKFLENSDANSVDYDELGYKKADFAKKFGLDSCLRGALRGRGGAQLSFQPLTFRVLLAEEVYLDTHKTPLVLPEGSEEFLTNRNIVSVVQAKAARHFAGFADCVVFRAPAQSDRLLRSKPSSDEERETIQSLVPALSDCIIEGDEMSLTPSNVRGFVADGLWARSRYGLKSKIATLASEVTTDA